MYLFLNIILFDDRKGNLNVKERRNPNMQEYETWVIVAWRLLAYASTFPELLLWSLHCHGNGSTAALMVNTGELSDLRLWLTTHTDEKSALQTPAETLTSDQQ